LQKSKINKAHALRADPFLSLCVTNKPMNLPKSNQRLPNFSQCLDWFSPGYLEFFFCVESAGGCGAAVTKRK